eukprot:2665773-Amphidinium_carterae.1
MALGGDAPGVGLCSVILVFAGGDHGEVVQCGSVDAHYGWETVDGGRDGDNVLEGRSSLPEECFGVLQVQFLWVSWNIIVWNRGEFVVELHQGAKQQLLLIGGKFHYGKQAGGMA